MHLVLSFALCAWCDWTIYMHMYMNIGVSTEVEIMWVFLCNNVSFFMIFFRSLRNIEIFKGFAATKWFEIKTTVSLPPQRHRHCHQHIFIIIIIVDCCSHPTIHHWDRFDVDKTELITNIATAMILHITLFGWLDSNGKTLAS